MTFGRYLPRGKTWYPIVQAVRLSTGRKRCRAIDLLFLDHGTRCVGTE